MKCHWVWGIFIKEASAKEPCVVQTFPSRQPAIDANNADYEGKGKVVRVAYYY